MSAEAADQTLVANNTTTTTNPPSNLSNVEKNLEKRPSQADLLNPAATKRARTDNEPTATTDDSSIPEVSSAINIAKEQIGTTELNAPQATQPKLLIKKLSDKARLPTKGSLLAAGYDVYSAHETVIPARGKALVDTDISIAVPEGCYGRIAPRSGLAAKNFIDVGAGVIDADYRGQVKILLFNHSDADFQVSQGDRVAQLILEKIYTPEVMEVQELEESTRGAAGFGSTGVSIN